jgi:hypothetical protein
VVGEVSSLAGLASGGGEVVRIKSGNAAGALGLRVGNNVAGSAAVALCAGDGSGEALVCASLAVFAGGLACLVVVCSCDAVGAGCLSVGDDVACCAAAARPARDGSVVRLIES